MVAFIVALGVLISVHEFGHFWVARRLGVKVLRFSVGFGRPLWLRHGRDGVEYVVAAIPFGGYVRMLDEREGPVPDQEKARAFNRQRLAVRTAVVAAGPVANLLLAVFLYWLVLIVGDTGIRPLVGEVLPESAAAQTGVHAGDEFLAINGRPTPTWERTLYAMVQAVVDGGEITIELRSENAESRTLVAEADLFRPLTDENGSIESIGVKMARPSLPPVVGEVLPGEAADQGGLQPGDRILAVDAEPVSSWSDWVDVVRAHPGSVLEIEVQRGTNVLTLPIRPEARRTADGVIGRIGAAAEVPEGFFERYRAVERLGPLAAMPAAARKTWDLSLLTLKVVWGMVTGRMSVHNLGGPITIAQSAGRSAAVGTVFFLKFLAVLSISIGILNLLPIPVLDGGHLLYYAIEAVRGKPLSEEAQLLGQKIGLFILALFMILAFYVDLSRLSIN
ncbi:MAG: RIP metalloprotease RseP [Pseudomonadota bacterium]